jgi:hypothetical protein
MKPLRQKISEQPFVELGQAQAFWPTGRTGDDVDIGGAQTVFANMFYRARAGQDFQRLLYFYHVCFVLSTSIFLY